MKFNKYWLWNIILSVLAICLICFWFHDVAFARQVQAEHDAGLKTEAVETDMQVETYYKPAAYYEERTCTEMESYSCRQEDDNNDLWYEAQEPEGEGDEIPYEEGVVLPDGLTEEELLELDIVPEDVELTDEPIDYSEGEPSDSLEDTVPEDAEVTDFPVDEDCEDGYGDY